MSFEIDDAFFEENDIFKYRVGRAFWNGGPCYLVKKTNKSITIIHPKVPEPRRTIFGFNSKTFNKYFLRLLLLKHLCSGYQLSGQEIVDKIVDELRNYTPVFEQEENEE